MAQKEVAGKLDQKEIGDVKKAIEDLVGSILTQLFGPARPIVVVADRFFFPKGVELIEVGATVGPKNTPIFEFSFKIAGAAGVHEAGAKQSDPWKSDPK